MSKRGRAVVDVVVIGAGLAGLSAARDLQSAGFDVLVLEARDRVGGRTERIEDGGIAFDGGGELIGEWQEPIITLAHELGLELEPSYIALPGESVWLSYDRRTEGEDRSFVGEKEWPSYRNAWDTALDLSQTLDPDSPWEHPQAHELDHVSVHDWFRDQGLGPRGLETIRLQHYSLSEDQPERASFLGALRSLAAAGSRSPFEFAVWENLRVRNGTFQIAARLADDLTGRIELETLVLGAERGPQGVFVRPAGREAVTALAAVLAVPATPLQRLQLAGVSQARLEALRRLRHARAAKVVVIYERSFWLHRGFNGLSYSDRLIGSTWEQRPGVLSCLVPPERLSAFLAASPERRRELVLDHIALLFGEEARRPLAYVERPWGEDPLTYGYIAHLGIGDLTAMGPLYAADEPPLFFAGSDFWRGGGYMCGAVETGRLAAIRIGGYLAGSGGRGDLDGVFTSS
jgi:monoamine oxidase